MLLRRILNPFLGSLRILFSFSEISCRLVAIFIPRKVYKRVIIDKYWFDINANVMLCSFLCFQSFKSHFLRVGIIIMTDRTGRNVNSWPLSPYAPEICFSSLYYLLIVCASASMCIEIMNIFFQIRPYVTQRWQSRFQFYAFSVKTSSFIKSRVIHIQLVYQKFSL